MRDPSDDPAKGAGAPAFAALGLRAADEASIRRICRALVVRGFFNPYPSGHSPAKEFGAYSTFLVIPAGETVSAGAGASFQIMEAVRLAYALGATQVSLWSEYADEVIPQTTAADGAPVATGSAWTQGALPL